MADSESKIRLTGTPVTSWPRQGPWRDVWYRLLHRKMAVFGMIIIALFIVVAVFAPTLAPHDPLVLEFEQSLLPPAWVKQSAIGKAGDPQHLLGTDEQGRDIVSRLIYGTQASMFIGLSTTLIVAFLGVLIGMTAGYAGGRIDNLIMRVADVFYAFPSIMLYVMIVLMLRDTKVGEWQNGLIMLISALASVGWVGLARLVRGVTLSLKTTEFVEAARCIGASSVRIIMRHILPNCLGVITVWMTFAIARMIIVEAMLGYVGVGLTPATSSSPSFFITSWGGLFLEGRIAINVHPIILLAPTVCVALVGMAFTFLGDALRDVIDPYMRNVIKRGS
jgi:ABC-type dipeptide/oligopeptide/nickel transport system permease subunit